MGGTVGMGPAGPGGGPRSDPADDEREVWPVRGRRYAC